MRFIVFVIYIMKKVKIDMRRNKTKVFDYRKPVRGMYDFDSENVEHDNVRNDENINNINDENINNGNNISDDMEIGNGEIVGMDDNVLTQHIDKLANHATNGINSAVGTINYATNRTSDVANQALQVSEAINQAMVAASALASVGKQVVDATKPAVVLICDNVGKFYNLVKGKLKSNPKIIISEGKFVTENGYVDPENVSIGKIDVNSKTKKITGGYEHQKIGGNDPTIAGFVSGLTLLASLQQTKGFNPNFTYLYDPITNSFALCTTRLALNTKLLEASFTKDSMHKFFSKIQGHVGDFEKGVADGIHKTHGILGHLASGVKKVEEEAGHLAAEGTALINNVYNIAGFIKKIPFIKTLSTNIIEDASIAAIEAEELAPLALMALGEDPMFPTSPFDVYRPDRKKHILMTIIVLCIVVTLLLIYYVETYYNKIHTDGSKSMFMPFIKVERSLSFLY